MSLKNKTNKIFSYSTKKLLWLFIAGSFFVFIFHSSALASSETKEIEDKLDKVEKELEESQQKEKTIQSELDVINGNIEVVQLQIQKTQTLIDDFDKQIDEKENGINAIEERMEIQKEILKKYIKLTQQGNSELDLILMNQEKNMGDYFEALDSYEIVQSKIKKILDEIRQDKTKLEEEKNSLEDDRTEQQKIYALQDDQKKSLQYEERKKNLFLEKTQENISLLDIERSELRKQLNALQSLGEPITLNEAIDAAEYASKKTDVRTAFLLGVLRVESNLGQNVGGGTYKVDMNPNQRDILRIFVMILATKLPKCQFQKEFATTPTLLTVVGDGEVPWGQPSSCHQLGWDIKTE